MNKASIYSLRHVAIHSTSGSFSWLSMQIVQRLKMFLYDNCDWATTSIDCMASSHVTTPRGEYSVERFRISTTAYARIVQRKESKVSRSSYHSIPTADPLCGLPESGSCGVILKVPTPKCFTFFSLLGNPAVAVLQISILHSSYSSFPISPPIP